MADAGGGGGVLYAARPDSLLSLRACSTCRLVKTLNQFQDGFCDNCWREWADGATPGSLKKTRCMDLAMENTTADFEGMTSMMRPFDSWVGKWLKMSALLFGWLPLGRAGRGWLAAQSQWEDGRGGGAFLTPTRYCKHHTPLFLSMNLADRIGEDGLKTMLKPGVYAITLPGFQRRTEHVEEEYEEEAEEGEGEADRASC
jgi:hypothetical protein